MFYSPSYRRATEEAGRILLENGISTYPLNPVVLACRAGIKILTYDQFSSLADIVQADLLALSEDGFSTCVDSQYLIVYNPFVRPRSRRRWTLLHEYCHIHLGHVPLNSTLVPGGPNERFMEAAADELTSCLIAPLPLIRLCGIESETELARCFGLSGLAAKNTFETYRKYCRGNQPPELGYGASLDRFGRFALEYNWRKERSARHRQYRLVDIEV